MMPRPEENDFSYNLALISLSREEWRLLISAVEAYQHNYQYRKLYKKLLAQQL